MPARSLLSITMLTFAATAVAAQNMPGALRNDGPRPGVAAWVATNPTDLQLTAAQLRQVQARMTQLEQELLPLRTQIQGLRTGRDFSTMTRSERHAVMMSAAALRGGMLTLMDSADANIRAMLNPTQQAAFDAHNRTLMGSHGMGRGPGSAAAPMRMQGNGMRGRGGMMMGGRRM